MATTREVLEFVIKADGTAAGSVFGKLGSQAEQAGKKLDSGLTSSLKGVGTFLGNNLPGLALAGGAAIGAFALKSASDFAGLALAAGKLSDATGLTSEQASRFIKVGEDVGISSDTLTTAFGKMNKAIGASPEKFAALGITATDTQGRILQAIDAINGIQDPAQKALVASQLFGRGWQQISELISQGGEQIQASLKAVSDTRVISSDDVSKARDYRASMNELKDAIDAVGLTIGRSLVPGIAAAASGLAKLLDSGPVKSALSLIGTAADAAGESLSNLTDWSQKAKTATDDSVESMKKISETLLQVGQSGDQGTIVFTNLADKMTYLQTHTAGGKEGIDNMNKAMADAAQSAMFYQSGLNYAAAANQYLAQQQVSADEIKAQGDAMVALADGAKIAAGWVKVLNEAEAQHLSITRDLLGLEADLPKQLNEVADAAATADKALAAAAKSGGKNADLNRKATDSYAELRGKILSTADSFQKQADEQDKAKGKTVDATTSTYHLAAGMLQAAGASRTAQLAALGFEQQLDHIRPDTQARVSVLVNEGKLPEAIALLQQGDGTRTATLNVRVTGQTALFQSIVAQVGGGLSKTLSRGFASGGDPPVGVPSIVGERGPEIFVPKVAGTILPHGTGFGGGGVVVNIGTVVANDPASLVTALERYVQAGGKGRLQKLVAA